MEEVDFQNAKAIRWTIGGSSFIAKPEIGARLIKWDFEGGASAGVRPVIYWPDDVPPRTDFAFVRGGNPILFPFSARSYADGDIYHWRDLAGVIRSMPLHGIARQSTFTVTRLDETGFSGVLDVSEEVKAVFPFDYGLEVEYRFGEKEVFVDMRLRNTGTRPLPWSPGHHFYLAVPWSAGLERRDYSIDIPARRILYEDERGCLRSGPAFARCEPLDNRTLVTAYHCDLTDRLAVVSETRSGAGLVLRVHDGRPISPDAGFMTWTQDENVPYYCVEPWFGPPNAIGNRRGVSWVPPGGSDSFSVSLTIY